MISNKTSIRNAVLSATTTLALLAGPAFADEPRLTVTFISDAAQGTSINRENYDRAVAKLEDVDRSGIQGFFIANNLCVSYLKVGEADKAQKSCEQAVDHIQDELINNRHVRTSDIVFGEYQKFLAIALSNRGVTYVVNEKPEQARADFAAAIEIQSGLRQPKINLARLEELAATSA